MLQKLKKYIELKYDLKCQLDIDLIINSNNTNESIKVSLIMEDIYINYDNFQIVSNKSTIFKDIKVVLDNLTYIYYYDFRNEIIASSIYVQNDKSLIDTVEDLLWDKNSKYHDSTYIVVKSFARGFSYRANISASFIDIFEIVYDEEHFKVLDALEKNFRYFKENYYELQSVRLKEIINNDFNLKAISKYFLNMGYCYLAHFTSEEKTIYKFIDIDYDKCDSLGNGEYVLISRDLKSILYKDPFDRYYIRGEITKEFQDIKSLISVGEDVCNYVHSIKTSRILYKDKIYESSGDTISDELNGLNELLDNNILSCFTCRYGNYIQNEDEIYCLKGFNPKNISDLIYMVDEARLIPSKVFNLCDDFMFQDDYVYVHTKCNYKLKD